MIDVTRIKEQINCRDLVERDLGKPKYRNNTYSTYKCPLHNEEKGFSLVVYEDHWRCFGKCGRGGDAIAWFQEYHNLSFQEACEWLSSGDLPQLQQPRHPQQLKAQPLSEPPDAGWQESAQKVAHQAMDTLWGREGKRAWRYLEEERGLTEDTIIRAGLGYVPGDYREWKTIEGLSVPCGITIPWLADGAIWGIKVRRAAGEQRYHQVSGGNIKGCLYLADDIKPGLPIMLTEGEFDALITRQAGVGLISVAAIGSAANKRINSRWFPKFITAPSILIRMDDDQAGQGASEQISSLSRAVKCIQVPQGKDINEFYLMAGQAPVGDWIKASLE
ncbi:MAG: toprim domain-containing protein [Anaerolineae bacterium]|nr:toprim domain-containing protein [Anaerolineae bacterium]